MRRARKKAINPMRIAEIVIRRIFCNTTRGGGATPLIRASSQTTGCAAPDTDAAVPAPSAPPSAVTPTGKIGTLICINGAATQSR